MNENQKRKCDVLNTLRVAAFERFDARRRAESRVMTLLWTAIAAFTLLVLKGEIGRLNCIAASIITLVAAFCMLAVCYWIKGMHAAFERDRKTSIFLEQQMMLLAETEFPPHLDTALKEMAKTEMPWFKKYSHFLQLSISVILLTLLVLSAWSKT